MYFCSKYKNWEHMTTSIDIARRIAEVNHPLSRESVHALAEILVCRKYRKGEIVLQAGEVCKAMLFIEKGMLRQFYYKYDKDLTEHIGYENGMIICIESYFKQEPTRLMVETLEASVVWELPHFYLRLLIPKIIRAIIIFRRQVQRITSRQYHHPTQQYAIKYFLHNPSYLLECNI